MKVVSGYRNERAVWDQRAEKELKIYMALRPDSFRDWSVKHHMEELAHEDTHKTMKFWYERAVDEQKKELREYKKRLKAQESSRIELVPMTIETIGGASSEQSSQDESIKGMGCDKIGLVS